MSVLIIGAAERQEIAALRARAAAAPISRAQMEVMSKGFDPEDPATREGRERIDIDFTIGLTGGFKVTYTLEQQPPGLCRHLSLSSGALGAVPHPAALIMVMQEFGFLATEGAPPEHGQSVLAAAMESGRLYAYTEHYGEGLVAINVIEQVDGAPLNA